MSRSRMAVAALLVPVAAGAVALLSAGVASAATPYSGNGYVGIRFDPNETQFIADTNAADFLEVVPNDYWSIALGEGSIYKGDGQHVYASIDQLVEETASHRGEISFSLTDPAIWNNNIYILQNW
ncbi:hypothetical protein [Rhodococcus sp. IEGM 1406]|uniref:hypothetical protein n=1 Tax=Rhodococcus sp. IEGM 1406 TaxID=3047083 RepID=UPI0024B84495|nr:hypothetical protein [Rhodococcus sp. IEGM 1406]MDI9909365.1 hypothetical protein [Rhodococcus sp. IEGM 1406]